MKEPAIVLAKNRFSKKERVGFRIGNNSAQTVFVMPTLFDALSLRGEVIQKGQGREKHLYTFDDRGSGTSHAEYKELEAIEILPDQSAEGFWEGHCFESVGPDVINDWKIARPSGTFKIRIAQYHAAEEASAGKPAAGWAESGFFSIQ